MTPCLAGEKSNKSSYGPSPQRPAVAPKVGPVILKAAALIFQLRAIIGLCPHDAGASSKQCPEHSQRPQIWGRLTEPKVGCSAQGAAYRADPLPGRGGATSQPRKMEGGETDSHPGGPPRFNIAQHQGSSSGHLSRQGEGQAVLAPRRFPSRTGQPHMPEIALPGRAVMPRTAPAAPRPGRLR